LHHLVLERWSRGASALHRRDPRAKIIPLLAFLTVLATARSGLPQLSGALFLLLAAALAFARVPLMGAMARAAIVLPFTAVFVIAYWVGGDPARGVGMALKSYVSALAALTLVATTPLPALLHGLERLRAPVFLLTVAQFLYRYLFVISEEGQHMAKAAAARGAARGGLSAGRGHFRAAAGALAVLFARSYGRAQDVHRAMLARGFTGRLQPLMESHFGVVDALFAVAASASPILVRIVLEKAA
jgi:cobalt/nickel transport system permease protein